MKTIHLHIDNNIVDKVMSFLNNLPKKNIRVEIEEAPVVKNKRPLTTLSLKTKNFTFDRNEAYER